MPFTHFDDGTPIDENDKRITDKPSSPKSPEARHPSSPTSKNQIKMVRRRAREEKEKERVLNIRDERQRKMKDSIDFNLLDEASKEANDYEISYMTQKALELYWNDNYDEW